MANAMLASEEGRTYVLHSGLLRAEWLLRILLEGKYLPPE